MTAAMWDQWAEMSISHRDPSDPDVAIVLHQLRHTAEVDRLVRGGRL